MTTEIDLNKPEKVLDASPLDSLQVTSCIDATTSNCGYTSGEVDGKAYSSEQFFEYIIGGNNLENELNNTDPAAIRWPALYASRMLSGIDPEHYRENDHQIKHARNHPAVAQAQKNADEILKQARHEKRKKMTPQEWLTWAENTSFIVYPPCRRLILHWQQLIADKLVNNTLPIIPDLTTPSEITVTKSTTIQPATKKISLSPEDETRRSTRWYKVLENLWPDILLKHPNKQLAEQVMAYLREHDKTGCIQSSPDMDVRHLHWKDEEDLPHTVTKKTVQTTISKLRKEYKKIPA